MSRDGLEGRNKKLIVHCCGGSGINVLDKNIDYLLKRESADKAELVLNAIDTSSANYPYAVRLREHSSFYRIGQDTLEGSGGIRKEAVKSVMSKQGVPTYVEEKNYIEPKKGELHVIVSSASGASGNVIATTLLKHLLEKDIPVLVILIGDDISAKTCENTKKVLITLNNMAAKSNKAISLSYFLNNQKDDSNESYKASQNKVDANIGVLIDMLRTFNGSPRDLDFKDISNFINPNLADYEMHRGLYMLSYHIGELKNEDFQSAIPVMSRSILVAPDAYTPLSLLDSKIGFADDEFKDNIVEHYGANNLSLILSAGGLNAEINGLEAKEDDIRSRAKNLKEALSVDNTKPYITLSDNDDFVM